ncbi:putative ribonuclease H-like domain-containing protein [Tanacetum coccineum]
MESEKYLERQSMQRPPLFESDGFIYWKNRFETYVKSKDLDLWHVITDGDFPPIQNNPETKKDEIVPFHKQNDDLKKKLAKNNEAKMVIYNALPRKEYERIFMCQTAKEIWDTLLITHQGNNQVKANKIDLLVQQYEQFMIPEEESIDNAFAKFNTIITSLKALDEYGKQTKTSYISQLIRTIKIIRCDKGTEFKNRVMGEFYEEKGIKKEFSTARTPQQNGVAKRRNRTLIEAARTMLADSKLPTTFWAEAVNTACYMQNKGDGPKWLFDIDVLKQNQMMKYWMCQMVSSQDYILMPLWKDGSLFDSSSKNASNDEPQPSSDAGKKDDEGVCKESGIDDQERPENSTQDVNTAGPSINTEPDMFSLGDNATLEATHADFFGDETEVDMSNITTTYPVPSTPNTRIHKDHSLDHVIGDVQSGVQTRRMTKTTNEQGFISVVYEGKTHEDLHTCLFACFLSQVEPKKVIQALTDPSWIEAMQDELLQFKLQKVWTLVDLPYGKRAIGTKWVYRNKKDERGIVVRNKARLVAQGYTQEEGIDYDEVFAPVARIEAIRLFLAYASFMNFVVYQMDVKSAFLYGKIEEEVYVCQPPGFEDPEFPDRVYKVEKELYGLHQAPRAWYETLSTYLLENRFTRGTIDKTLFFKKVKGDILLVQIYVDGIIFRSTKMELCTEFKKLMHKKFQMSSMGELTLFLGLQVMQKEDGTFISQDKYADEILKKFGFSTVRITSTSMETSKPLLKDAEAEDVDIYLYRSMIGSLMSLTASRHDIMFAVKLKDSPFDLEAYTDSDYAGANMPLTIQALVDGKKVIVTETSVRRALQLKDAEGTECLPNATIFAELERMSAMTTAWNKISSTMASAIIVFDEQEVEVEKVVSTAEVTTASATTTTVDELTLAQTLIEIKAAKPKAEPSEFRTTTSSSQTSQLPQVKDKGKAKMIEPEKPLKKKDQILVDEEIAQRLQEELPQAELEEEERLAR